MSQEVSKRYAQRGVSASKEDVHNAIKNIDKGLFPKAFCKIVLDSNWFSRLENLITILLSLKKISSYSEPVFSSMFVSSFINNWSADLPDSV